MDVGRFLGEKTKYWSCKSAQNVLKLNENDSNMLQILQRIFLSSYDLIRLSDLLTSGFPETLILGCSTAGEIYNGMLEKNSVVAMAFTSRIIADAKLYLPKSLIRKS